MVSFSSIISGFVVVFVVQVIVVVDFSIVDVIVIQVVDAFLDGGVVDVFNDQVVDVDAVAQLLAVLAKKVFL